MAVAIIWRAAAAAAAMTFESIPPILGVQCTSLHEIHIGGGGGAIRYDDRGQIGAKASPPSGWVGARERDGVRRSNEIAVVVVAVGGGGICVFVVTCLVPMPRPFFLEAERAKDLKGDKNLSFAEYRIGLWAQKPMSHGKLPSLLPIQGRNITSPLM